MGIETRPVNMSLFHWNKEDWESSCLWQYLAICDQVGENLLNIPEPFYPGNLDQARGKKLAPIWCSDLLEYNDGDT